MASHIRAVGKEYHPLAVGRNVGEPVVEVVGEDLLLLAAIGLHAPDLHVSSTLGVEVNVFAVRRIFGTVIQSLGRGETDLFATGCGDCIDIKFAVALADEGERLAVGRPTMPVRRRLLRDPAWRSTSDGDDVNERLVIAL